MRHNAPEGIEDQPGWQDYRKLDNPTTALRAEAFLATLRERDRRVRKNGIRAAAIGASALAVGIVGYAIAAQPHHAASQSRAASQPLPLGCVPEAALTPSPNLSPGQYAPIAARAIACIADKASALFGSTVTDVPNGTYLYLSMPGGDGTTLRMGYQSSKTTLTPTGSISPNPSDITSLFLENGQSSSKAPLETIRFGYNPQNGNWTASKSDYIAIPYTPATAMEEASLILQTATDVLTSAGA